MTARPHRWIAAALALACAAAATGCGLGEEEGAGTAELTVTRDHGSRLLMRETVELSASDTVLRVLDRSAEIETRFGGGFVQAIDGLAGGSEGGERADWFFYVNGIESPHGSADYELSDGERVWWDRRGWTTAMRAPAVVGSWPEPFLHGFDGELWPASVVCLTAEEVCEPARERLREAGVEDAGAAPGDEAIRVLVGPWRRLARDEDARLLVEGPDRSGVFATFTRGSRTELLVLDARGDPVRRLGAGAGLVAALRPGDGPPTWVVAGTDDAGARAAAETLGDGLRDRYALVSSGDEMFGAPVP